MSLSATYVDQDTFTVSGNYADYLIVDRMVRCDCGADGIKKRVVTSSSYAGGTTTVNLKADATRNLTANLDTFEWSVVKPGSVGNITLHEHTDDDDGGEIDGDILDIDWDPSNYTPATTPAQASDVDDLAAHLYGIDQGFAGLTIGSDVQAWDDDLDDLAALAHSDGNFIVSDGTDWVVESGDTALASLGLSANLGDLTDSEAAQLENIGAVTISAAQWGYLGALDQALASSDSPTFAGLTLSGDIDLDGNDLIIDSDGDTLLRAGVDDNVELVIPAAGEFAIDIDGVDVHIFEEQIVHLNRELRIYGGGGDYVALTCPYPTE